MKKVLLGLLLLNGCTVTVQPPPDLALEVKAQGEAIKAHSEALTQIAQYVGNLQAKGVLPKPEPKGK